MADGQPKLTVAVKNNGNQIGSQQLETGFNRFAISGMGPGSVSVEIQGDGGNVLFSGTGPIEVGIFNIEDLLKAYVSRLCHLLHCATTISKLLP